ncbi:MAG: peptidylprolyl isomerase [Pseudomonadales bacterium]|nr:peptidylprolyl isomerase [Pseudomonadales bacterium]
MKKQLKISSQLIYFGLSLVLALTSAGLVQAEVQWLDRSIAIVDDDVILQSEYDARLKTTELRIKNRPEGAQKPSQDMVEAQVMDGLILKSIQVQMAGRRGIRISEDELNNAIKGIARQNGMSLPDFKKALQSEGVSYLDAREGIRDEILLSRVQQAALRNRVAVSDQEVDSYLNSEEGQKQLSTEYLIAHILLLVPPGASVDRLSDIELAANKLADDFKQGVSFVDVSKMAVWDGNALRSSDLGWRRTVEIPGLFAKQVPGMRIGDVVGPTQSASGFHFIQLTGKRGGAEHIVEEVLIRHILISPNEVRTEDDTLQLALSLSQRIKDGEDFAELAKQFSDDPGSGSEGGKLGWSSYDKYVPAFATAARELPVGKMSEPVKTQFGWHILEVVERRTEDRSVEYQRNQIRNLIYRRKYEEEKYSWFRKIREEAYVEFIDDGSEKSVVPPAE